MNESEPKHSVRRTGLFMLVASCVIGLGILTVFFEALLDRRQNPNRNPFSQTAADGGIVVQLQRNPQGHYLAGGFVNGARANFLLDTGATDVVVPAELATEARLQAGQPTRARTANGDVTVYAALIDELVIGDIVLSNVRASINPAMHGNTVLLGMSALRHIEFTQRGNLMTLRYIP
jgi:aspartyl protease family protein